MTEQFEKENIILSLRQPAQLLLKGIYVETSDVIIQEKEDAIKVYETPQIIPLDTKLLLYHQDFCAASLSFPSTIQEIETISPASGQFQSSQQSQQGQHQYIVQLKTNHHVTLNLLQTCDFFRTRPSCVVGCYQITNLSSSYFPIRIISIVDAHKLLIETPLKFQFCKADENMSENNSNNNRNITPSWGFLRLPSPMTLEELISLCSNCNAESYSSYGSTNPNRLSSADPIDSSAKDFWKFTFQEIPNKLQTIQITVEMRSESETMLQKIPNTQLYMSAYFRDWFGKSSDSTLELPQSNQQSNKSSGVVLSESSFLLSSTPAASAAAASSNVLNAKVTHRLFSSTANFTDTITTKSQGLHATEYNPDGSKAKTPSRFWLPFIGRRESVKNINPCLTKKALVAGDPARADHARGDQADNKYANFNKDDGEHGQGHLHFHGQYWSIYQLNRRYLEYFSNPRENFVRFDCEISCIVSVLSHKSGALPVARVQDGQSISEFITNTNQQIQSVIASPTNAGAGAGSSTSSMLGMQPYVYVTEDEAQLIWRHINGLLYSATLQVRKYSLQEFQLELARVLNEGSSTFQSDSSDPNKAQQFNSSQLSKPYQPCHCLKPNSFPSAPIDIKIQKAQVNNKNSSNNPCHTSHSNEKNTNDLEDVILAPVFSVDIAPTGNQQYAVAIRNSQYLWHPGLGNFWTTFGFSTMTNYQSIHSGFFKPDQNNNNHNHISSSLFNPTTTPSFTLSQNYKIDFEPKTKCIELTLVAKKEVLKLTDKLRARSEEKVSFISSINPSTTKEGNYSVSLIQTKTPHVLNVGSLFQIRSTDTIVQMKLTENYTFLTGVHMVMAVFSPILFQSSMGVNGMTFEMDSVVNLLQFDLYLNVLPTEFTWCVVDPYVASRLGANRVAVATNTNNYRASANEHVWFNLPKFLNLSLTIFPKRLQQSTCCSNEHQEQSLGWFSTNQAHSTLIALPSLNCNCKYSLQAYYKRNCHYPMIHQDKTQLIFEKKSSPQKNLKETEASDASGRANNNNRNMIEDDEWISSNIYEIE